MHGEIEENHKIIPEISVAGPKIETFPTNTQNDSHLTET
jgi:hypothetical protein